MRISHMAGCGLITLTLAACGSFTPDAKLSDVSSAVAERTGAALMRLDTAPLEALSGPLTPELAAKSALQYNLLLQAKLDDLNVASAEEVQAGLLVNPSLDGEFMFGDGSPTLNFGLGFELGQLLTRSRRMKIATADRQRVEAEAIEAAVKTYSEAKIDAVSLWARQQSLNVIKDIVIARDSAANAADVIARAGNLTAGDYARYKRAALLGQLMLGQGQLGQIDDMEALSNTIGVAVANDLTISLGNEGDPAPRDATAFVKAAVENSLSLEAERRRIEGLGARVGLANVSVWLDHIEAGAVLEREDGETEPGFSVALSLPLFDNGQVRTGAARAALEAAEQRYRAMAFMTANRARALLQVLDVARTASADLTQRLVLQADNEFDFENRQLNAMQIGPFSLIEARVQQLEATLVAIDMKRLFLVTNIQADALMAGVVVGGASALDIATPFGPAGGEDH